MHIVTFSSQILTIIGSKEWNAMTNPLKIVDSPMAPVLVSS
jgi:hypothetical protein